jgi:hypothetical protein
MAQHAAANVQHYRPMPENKDSEGAVVTAAEESVQQLLIVFLMALLRCQPAAKITNAGGQCGTTHAAEFPCSPTLPSFA